VTQSDPHPGLHYERWVDDAIPARIDMVRVDLTSQELGLFATKEIDRGLTTGEYAARINAQVAINGDAFSVAGYRPRGLAIGDSQPWSNTSDDDSSAVLHFHRAAQDGHERTVATMLLPPKTPVTPSDLPVDTQGAVSGRPLLVRNGQVETQFASG